MSVNDTKKISILGLSEVNLQVRINLSMFKIILNEKFYQKNADINIVRLFIYSYKL